MGNSLNLPSINNFYNLTNLSLEQFIEQTKRKMTIHILSDKAEDCKSFVNLITEEEINNDSTQLLEINIKQKKNLFSFMNYKIYTSPDILLKEIIAKAKNISENPKSFNDYSEVLLILDNKNIIEQINNIKIELFENKTNKYFFIQKSYLYPFIIFLSDKDLNLKDLDFVPSKTFHYKINPSIIKIFHNSKKEDKDNKNNNDKYALEYFSFFRKLKVIFSYYNELGDEFSFINSENKPIKIIMKIIMNILYLLIYFY